MSGVENEPPAGSGPAEAPPAPYQSFRLDHCSLVSKDLVRGVEELRSQATPVADFTYRYRYRRQ
jgi:hypothetical protein